MKKTKDKFFRLFFLLKKNINIKKNKKYFRIPNTPFVDKKISVEKMILIKKKIPRIIKIWVVVIVHLMLPI